MPNSYADYDVPRSIYGNRGQQRLCFEERALQGRLDELSSKRNKLANELHGLISQVSEEERDERLGEVNIVLNYENYYEKIVSVSNLTEIDNLKS